MAEPAASAPDGPSASPPPVSGNDGGRVPAAKPVLLVVDDDADVLRAITRDLRGHYGSRYRIISADSGEAALQTLKDLAGRDVDTDLVALVLADQRMPGMCGVELLQQTKTIAPTARRVLLTAYADTDAAIDAINTVQLHHYLLKPWDPPEEKLYPVLDDLLDDWQAEFRPRYEGLRVLGLRFSPGSHAVRDYLARHQVPFQWVDVQFARQAGSGGDPQVQRALAELGADFGCLPVVLFPDGSRLVQPTPPQIAERIGLRTHAERPFYDLVIVGGGPAGLAAAVYGGSEGLSTLMVERDAPGGQAGTSSRIENYLGFPSGISGADLARRAYVQAQRFHVEVLAQEAAAIRIEGPYRIVSLAACDAADAERTDVSCHALLITTGVSWRQLSEVPDVDRYTGAGIYYGASLTEGDSCTDEEVFIIGGANSAGQGAMYFSEHARAVTMLVRGDGLEKSMSEYLIDQIRATPNIRVRTRTRLIGVGGDGHLERITIADDAAGTQETIPATSVFVFIGAEPRTDWLTEQLARDGHGFLQTGPDIPHDPRTGKPAAWPLDRDPYLLETNVPGVFAAGDVRSGSVKRIAAGVGEGGVAVAMIHRYLASVR
jgi:thioredoxin reductase (NADPH)